MGNYVKALLLIALLFLAITFGTQNSESLILRYYFGIASIPLPLYLIIYLAIILGILGGMAVDVYTRVSLKRKVKELGKANTSLREELDQLKGEVGEETKEKPEMVPAQTGAQQTQVLPSSSSDPEDEEKAESD